MPLEAVYPHIVKEEGQPARLEGHARTRVAMIVTDYRWRGWSVEEIALKYPYLTPAEVHSAMAYYFDHREEIDQELAAEHEEAEAWRHSHPTSPLLLGL